MMTTFKWIAQTSLPLAKVTKKRVATLSKNQCKRQQQSTCEQTEGDEIFRNRVQVLCTLCPISHCAYVLHCFQSQAKKQNTWRNLNWNRWNIQIKAARKKKRQRKKRFRAICRTPTKSWIGTTSAIAIKSTKRVCAMNNCDESFQYWLLCERANYPSDNKFHQINEIARSFFIGAWIQSVRRIVCYSASGPSCLFVFLFLFFFNNSRPWQLSRPNVHGFRVRFNVSSWISVWTALALIVESVQSKCSSVGLLPPSALFFFLRNDVKLLQKGIELCRTAVNKRIPVSKRERNNEQIIDLRSQLTVRWFQSNGTGIE